MLRVDPFAYSTEFESELHSILQWWMGFALDPNGGFIGKIDHDHNIYPDSPKGSVLNARILWAFSAAYNGLGQELYLQHAHLSYKYICDHFIDKEFGGVYWAVDAAGQPLSTRKQVYAIAFAIYALAEYSVAAGSDEAKGLAIALYRNLEEHSFDSKRTGYFEAFNRNWSEIEDLRLSDKDANEKKTMNTHLHVLESYTNLYRIWKDEELKLQISNLINNFKDIIIQDSFHLNLFMDEDWKVKPSPISFGHDIEASWLLLEAADLIGDEQIIQSVKSIAVRMAKSALEGVDQDGALFYEFDQNSGCIIKEKHWWVQSEAIVGFFNAWEISGDQLFLDKSIQVWEYVKRSIIDSINGEWVWGRDENGYIMRSEDKAGIWKCPYHNSRACLEMIKRLKKYSELVISN